MMGKLLVVVGLLIAAIGAAILLGLPLGRLPGDLVIRRGHTTLYLPIVTSLVSAWCCRSCSRGCVAESGGDGENGVRPHFRGRGTFTTDCSAAHGAARRRHMTIKADRWIKRMALEHG